MPRLIGPGLLTAITVVTLLASGGQAVASHVQCGDLITQDTMLDSDLVDCPGDGIVIGADDITLDLGGHTVDGDGVGCGGGIANGSVLREVQCVFPSQRGHDRVVVTNGTVREFYIGVELEQANDNALQRLRVVDQRAPSIFLHESSGAVIEDNIVTGFSTGIFLADGSDGNVIGRNVIAGNGGHGFDQVDSKLNRIEMNVVSRNNGDGINGLGFDEMLVMHNLVTANRGAGIGVEDSAAENRIEGNRILDNGGPGIFMGEGAHQNQVEGNSVLRNARNPGFEGGIVILEGNRSVIENNRVSANGGRGGIVLSGLNRENVIRANRVAGNIAGGIVLDQGAVDDNLIEANNVTRNGGDGIQVDIQTGGRPVGNVVRRNLALGNGDDGIDTESALTTIGSNIANRNGDLGIEAVSGVIDGGRNRAAGNGNPLQCLNIFCR
jgi:parallel beta-helix repeat protein